MITLQSKLPNVGTTIFTVMSALATERNAVNLGQGFPDFDCDPNLVDAVTQAMQQGKNQYPPMTGVPVLREAVAAGGRPDVLQLPPRAVDVEVAGRGDPAVGTAGDPLEVLLGTGGADQHRDV